MFEQAAQDDDVEPSAGDFQNAELELLCLRRAGSPRVLQVILGTEGSPK